MSKTIKGSASVPNLTTSNEEILDQQIEGSVSEKTLKKTSSVRDFFRTRSFFKEVKVAAGNEILMSTPPEGFKPVEKEVAESFAKSVIEQGTFEAISNNEEYLNAFMTRGSATLEEENKESPRSNPNSPRVDEKEQKERGGKNR
jgi:hypothetical protein